jgi:hypothetical protein
LPEAGLFTVGFVCDACDIECGLILSTSNLRLDTVGFAGQIARVVSCAEMRKHSETLMELENVLVDAGSTL